MSNISTESKKDAYFNGEWLRKATDMEITMEEEHKHGIRIWYQLNLSSIQPLQEDHVRQALDHLYRKVPNFGVCYGFREGTLWLKRATDTNVDFKILEDQKLEDIRNSLHQYNFNGETGPLFCARLQQESSDVDTDIEDIEPSFPYKYNIFFGMDHSVTDGTTNMQIMGFFITLLNDVISNKPVNDEVSLGTFVTDEETLKVLMEKKALIEADPDLKKKLSVEFEFRKKQTPVIVKGFHATKEKLGTATILDVLDESTTSMFIQRCRQEKVTVNSALSALANVAIVDILAENGFIQESYMIQNLHSINVRRYWEVQTPKSLGCHMAFPLFICIDTPRKLNQFWKYAKSLNCVLRNDVESGKILLDQAFQRLTSDDIQHSKENSQISVNYLGDYITSSMGNVTESVTIGGDHVRITNLLRSTAIHGTEHVLLFNSHTFRGRLSFMFDYNTQVLEATVAKRIQSQLLKRLQESLK